MKPKWQKLASLAQKICTLKFQFFGAVFASKGYLFKNIFQRGSNIFKGRGGPRGPSCLFPIEISITFDLPGGV